MATYDGQRQAIFLVADQGDEDAEQVLDLRKIDIPDGSGEIDITSADDVTGGYKRTRPSLKDGKFTFECLYNPENTTLLARIADGAAVDAYVYADNGDDAAILAWSVRLTASTSIPYDGAISMTVTARRQGAAS